MFSALSIINYSGHGCGSRIFFKKVCKKMSTTNFQHSQLEQASIVSENNFPHSHNRNSFLTSNNGEPSFPALLSSWAVWDHQEYFLLLYSHLVVLANFAFLVTPLLFYNSLCTLLVMVDIVLPR